MNTQQHWDDEAAEYDAVMGSDPTIAALHSEIASKLPDPPGPVLDLGCGTGMLMYRIARQFPDVELIGLDPSANMRALAHQRLPQAQLLDASAKEIPLPDHSMATVISNFALHHLDHEDKAQCANEVFRVLRPGGVFLFGDQHVQTMGGPSDSNWQEEVLDLFTEKARFYLRNASPDRMLLQIRLLPRFLTADGEIPATQEYWSEQLTRAGLTVEEIVEIAPAHLHNRVIVARKPL